MRKILRFILSHKILAIIILGAIVGGGYFGYQKLAENSGETKYTTAIVEKGMLISSISGSGQVSASDQVDIKPSTSGNIVYVGVASGQEVKKNTLLAQIDAREAQMSVSNAEIALENAKIDLEELLEPADALSLLQAENALYQAEVDLERAEETYSNIEVDAEETISDAYNDGYDEVSAAFFSLPDYMEDLSDVSGTEVSGERYIVLYKIILGDDSLLIQRFLGDLEEAEDLYAANLTFFGNTFKDDDRDAVYGLLNDTLETSEVILRALESARHMYDAIIIEDYSGYTDSNIIDTMRVRIKNDLSPVASIINSLEKNIETIDDTIENLPYEIKDAELALNTAREKYEDKKEALEDLKTGASDLDIRSQRNTVAQKEDALSTAKEKLADCYIRAPFDGVVAEFNVIRGDSVSSGTTVATMITNQKIAEITLNEIDAVQVKPGQKVTLTFDAIENLTVTGEVAEIDMLGTVTQGVVSYDVKIAFDIQDERVKPGMSLGASIITESKPGVLLVPSAAVKSQGDIDYVEILVDGQPQRKTVTIGSSNDTMIEIIDGLSEGDVVVTQTTTSQTNSNNNSNGMPGGDMGGMMRMMR